MARTRVQSARSDTRIRTAEMKKEVIELRRQRLTFKEIGERIGRSAPRAHQLYTAALADITRLTVENHVDEMLDQLDLVERAVLAVLHRHHVTVSQGHTVSEIAGHWPMIDVHGVPLTVADSAGNPVHNPAAGEPHPKAGDPIYGDALIDDGPTMDAARTLITIMSRKAKLLGTDAPAKVSIDATVRTERDTADLVAAVHAAITAMPVDESARIAACMAAAAYFDRIGGV